MRCLLKAGGFARACQPALPEGVGDVEPAMVGMGPARGGGLRGRRDPGPTDARPPRDAARGADPPGCRRTKTTEERREAPPQAGTGSPAAQAVAGVEAEGGVIETWGRLLACPPISIE